MGGTEAANHVKVEEPAGHYSVCTLLDQKTQLDPNDSKWDKLGLPHGQEGIVRGWNMVMEQGRHPQKSDYSKDYRMKGILSHSVTKE